VASFLIVDDDPSFASAAARQYRSFGAARAVGTLTEAAYAIHHDRWTGVVLDVLFPDGSGLDFLAGARRTNAWTESLRSVLVCSGMDEAKMRARSRSLAACFLPKLAEPSGHCRFARRAIAAEYVRDEAAEGVAEIAQQYALSAMQTRVLALQVAAVPRADWAELLGGVKASTIKTHVHRLCKHANASSLAELAAPIISSVMTHGRDLFRAQEYPQPVTSRLREYRDN
jgi:DNA-binding NarL/FixJ family response regulator